MYNNSYWVHKCFRPGFYFVASILWVIILLKYLHDVCNVAYLIGKHAFLACRVFFFYFFALRTVWFCNTLFRTCYLFLCVYCFCINSKSINKKTVVIPDEEKWNTEVTQIYSTETWTWKSLHFHMKKYLKWIVLIYNIIWMQNNF